MRMNLRQCVFALAIVLGIGITSGPIRVVASTSSQDRDHPAEDQGNNQDYSKNKNYQVGMRDGKDDKAHNKDHSKKRSFKKDEDQKAYESGYQRGHQGDQPDHH
jgi:hypothetical protein